MSMKLDELAARIGATVDGDGSVAVSGCAPINTAGPDEISFLANVKYTRYLADTRAAAVLVGPDVQVPDSVVALVCDDPYFAFRNALIELYGYRTHPHPMNSSAADSGAVISEQARVHESAQLGEKAQIHPFAVVETGARIGARTVLYPGVYVGENAVVGDDCILYPNVTVYDHCVLGNRVILHSSTVVGQDGFGYSTHKGAHHKIPQTGIVVLEDDVELGGGCAIERAAMGETRIGKGTKFADLISIGHGTTIGAHCLFVSFVGVSGSVEVGNYVVLGGQVGITGHLKVGDGVQAMARSAIVRDVESGTKVGGAPAVSADIARRNAMASADLHSLVKRVRELERQVTSLNAQLKQ